MKYILIVTFMAVVSLFGEDSPSVTHDNKEGTLLRKYLINITKILELGTVYDLKDAKQEAECNSNIKKIVSSLGGLDELREFSILTFHISRLEPREGGGDPPNTSWLFHLAFHEALTVIAKNKTKAAYKTFNRIRACIQLDGGDSLDFKSIQAKQSDPNFK